ncbi:WD40 repeat domain-containing protein [Actinosynnema sp. NPDC050436]|uniref:YncE family protein n=1 Tax=Actinosynnema sp. NPDC050436 TaxID=3155659 RepID=UPI0033CC4C94
MPLPCPEETDVSRLSSTVKASRALAAVALAVGASAAGVAPASADTPQIDLVQLGNFLPTEAVVSPDGRYTYLSAGGREREVQLIKVVDNAARAVSATYALEEDSDDVTIKDLAVSPDGSELYALTTQRLAVLDARTGRTTASVTPPATRDLWSLALTPDGHALVIGEQGSIDDEVEVRLYTVDVASRSVVAGAELQRPWLGELVADPDNRRVYAATAGYGDDQNAASAIETYDAATGTQIGNNGVLWGVAENETLRNIRISKDRRTFWALKDRTHIEGWELEEFTNWFYMALATEKRVNTLALRPDEKYLYVGIDRAAHAAGPTVAVVEGGISLRTTLTGFSGDRITALTTNPSGTELYAATVRGAGDRVKGAFQVVRL